MFHDRKKSQKLSGVSPKNPLTHLRLSTNSSQYHKVTSKQQTPQMMIVTPRTEDEGHAINSGEVVLYKPSLVGEDSNSGLMRTFGKVPGLKIRRGSEGSSNSGGVSPLKFSYKLQTQA